MIEGVPASCARIMPGTSGRNGFRRAAGSNGRTARWRRPSRPKIPKACAARSFAPPGRDELAKWRHAEATFDMLQFGLRLGERPRQVITTTPRPIALIKRLIADPTHRGDARRHARECAQSRRRRSSTRSWRATHGTRLGRQELDGEIIEERADALWSRAADREHAASRTRRRCSASWWRSIRRPRRRKRADACGLVAAGRAEDDIDLRARRRDGGGPLARRLGRARRSRCGGGWKPTRSWSRSTRAATWCAR